MTEPTQRRGGLRKRTRPFTATPNDTVDDFTISYRALGILVKLLRQPDGWDVRADQLANEGKHSEDRKSKREGREAVRTALRELAVAGYYRLERIRLCQGDRMGQFVMSTAISEEPVNSWSEQAKLFEGKAVPLYEQADGSLLVKYPDGTLTPDDFPVPTGMANRTNPEDGSSGPGFPDTGDAATGEPSTAKASPFKEELPKTGYKDSVPPTEVRRETGDDAVQPTLTGEVAQRTERDIHNEAMGIARRWIDKWEEPQPDGTQLKILMHSRKGNPQQAIANAIKFAIREHVSELHITRAMAWANMDIPDANQLRRGLTQVQRGWKPAPDWLPGKPHSANGRSYGRPAEVPSVNASWEGVQGGRVEPGAPVAAVAGGSW